MIDETEREELIEVAATYVARDRDAYSFRDEIIDAFDVLLNFCDVEYGSKPEYHDSEYGIDKPISDLLIQEYISFASGVGGSTSEYAANDIISGLDSIDAYLIPVDAEGVMDVLYEQITQHAVSPNHELNRLADAGIYAD